ncbi:MAG: hypothetical protein HW403_766 [Dehalococcoidia bacterium]|nr:hypothetical protein [Dehalococcoidia bacterium]
MPWIRLSTFRPTPGSRRDIDRILERLEDILSKKKGFVMTLHFAVSDESGDMGRFTIWETPEDADHASADDDVVALRSQLILDIQLGHLDFVAEIVGTPRGAFTGK